MFRPAVAFSVSLLAAALIAACDQRPAEPELDADAPRLVLLIVVDQLRADYLDRFGGQFQSGLARLVAEGVVFTNAAHDHASTTTAPGYATVSTGVIPRRHGIIGNGWYDRSGDYTWAVGDDDIDPSPRRLLASTIGDWLRRARPGAQVYAVAGKDRSAVLLGGHDAHGAFWYSRSEGEIETSDYYFARAPEWLADFNRKRWADEGFGEPWEALPVEPEELDRLGIVPFDEGPTVSVFPHPVGRIELAPGDTYHSALYRTPRLDELTAKFAAHLLRTHDLGGDAIPDLLAVGFSAPDTVGHGFGPDSRELLDTLMRLDRTLGELLAEIDERVGRDRVVVVLTSDHGVSDVPEVRQQRGLSGGRPGLEEIVCMQRVERELAERFGEETWVLPGSFLNERAMADRDVSRPELEAEAERLIERCPSVAEVWTRAELAGDDPSADPRARRFHNAFHPNRSPDLTIQYVEHFVNSSALASHGTVYDYDTRVPIVVRAPGTTAGARVDLPVRTVDVAPTLAALLGVPRPGDLDGRPLPLPSPGEVE